MKLKIISLAACLAFCTDGMAQKSKSNPAVSSSSVDFYLEQYDFDNAEAQLERNIKMLQRKKQSTEEAEKQLDKIDMARAMLHATERVVFIDSIVTDKATFLDAIKITPESGTLTSYAKFFGTGDSVGSVYLSELGNKIYYSVPTQKADGQGSRKTRIFTSDLLGGQWSKATQVKGLNEDEDQDYPFMLSDGVTLYYGARGEESLGGYDIFVTRYDADNKTFLKPENIGMPFNSPTNDYLYAIDEINNLGWLVTDRCQPAGKVCIYIFVPNALRKTYDSEAYSEEELKGLARISSIAATWGDADLMAEARERLEQVMNEKQDVVKPKDFDFVINDDLTYTLVAEFRSPEAQKMASWWKEGQAQLTKSKETLLQLRNAYAQGNESRKQQLKQQILTMEQAYEKLYYGLEEQEVKIRNTEINYLKSSK